MPYPADTPYQILDISPSASQEEIKKARDRALRRRQQPTQKIMQAFNDLRNPKSRIETDLMVMTDVGNEKELEEFLTSVSPSDFLPVEVPVLSNHPALLGSGLFDPGSDCMEIPANPYQPDGYQPPADLPVVLQILSIPD